MKEYISKPIRVRAIQYTGDNFEEIKKVSEGIQESLLNTGDYVVLDGYSLVLSEEGFKFRYEEI